MSKETQNLTIVNLDKLVEDVIEVGEPMLEHPDQKLLQRIFTPTDESIKLEHNHYFALFKLIYEQPEKAIDMLEKVADQQTKNSHYGRYHRHKFKKAQKGGKSFIKESKKELRLLFLHRARQPPSMTPYDISYFLAVIKHDPLGSLDVFQKCYEKIYQFASKPQIPTIINCLRTKNFYKEGTHQLELRFVPIEETLEIPEEIDAKNPTGLSKYFMKLEGASPENLGFIEDHAILIPRKGEADWSKGLYIVTHPCPCCAKLETDTVYKTEKLYSNEEIVSKTIPHGKIIRASQEKFTAFLFKILLKKFQEQGEKCQPKK